MTTAAWNLLTAPPGHGPPWQRGYDLAMLQTISALFKEFDAGLVFGAFTGVNEAAVAEWLSAGELTVWGGTQPELAVRIQRPRVRVPVYDFRDEVACTIGAHDIVVRRYAHRPGTDSLLERQLGHASWVECWAEQPAERARLARLGFRWCATKIAASSEIRQVWGRDSGGSMLFEGEPYSRVELLSLAPMPDELDPAPNLFAAAVDAVNRLGLHWEQHYSTYNAKASWSALALRGYGGLAEFIIKPAEMSAKWKRDHPGECKHYTVKDTPLRAQLPELEPLLDNVLRLAPEVQRIRLMRLEPGGGELKRHADITDREAGVAVGKVARLHLPLVTNPSVLFESWSADGVRVQRHMGLARWWYLDQRKPHTARNGGTEPRIHLVVDAVVSPALHAALGAAANP